MTLYLQTEDIFSSICSLDCMYIDWLHFGCFNCLLLKYLLCLFIVQLTPLNIDTICHDAQSKTVSKLHLSISVSLILSGLFDVVRTCENDWVRRFVDYKDLWIIKLRLLTLKAQWHQMVAFRSFHCHPGLTYIFKFWHSGTLVLRAERHSARMSEIKNVG